MSEERQPLQNPPIEPPQSAMMPGMSSPQPETFLGVGTLAANIHDSSRPGPPTQPGPPRPPGWTYDFDPNSGIARATFDGEVSFTTGGSETAGVTSWNGRTGSVTLTTADLTAVGALFNPSPDLEGVPTCVTANPGTSDNQVASTQFVSQAIAANAGVTTFNGRSGAVSLALSDIVSAGGAPLNSPSFTGSPQAVTPPLTDSSSALATTAFVNNWGAQNTVLSFNGRRGAVALNLSDVTSVGGAPILSPSFTGVPVVPTAPPNTATGQAASTAYVMNAITASASGVVSFNGRSGVVTLTTADVVGAGGAPIDSPVLTGDAQAPTPSAGDASDKIATTQFVETAISSMSPVVTTFNGRSGAVTLQLSDVTSVGGAPLASPAMTGTPSAPEPPPGDNSTRLATTSFVETAIAAIPPPAVGVSTFNGRSGTVTLNGTDITGAGGALLAAPALTGAATLNGSPIATTATLAGYLPLSGGTLTGALTLGGSSSGLTVGGGLAVSQTATFSSVINANGGMNTTNINGISCTFNGGPITNIFGRIVSEGGNLPSFCCFDTAGGQAAGIYETNANLYFGAMDSGGNAAIQYGFFDRNGNLTITGGLTQGCDARGKEDIEDLNIMAMATVEELQPKSYRRIGSERLEWGFVAQDVQEVIPHAVSEYADSVDQSETHLALDTNNILATVVAALKELNERLERIENAQKE